MRDREQRLCAFGPGRIGGLCSGCVTGGAAGPDFAFAMRLRLVCSRPFPSALWFAARTPRFKKAVSHLPAAMC